MSNARARDRLVWRVVFPNVRRQERERFTFLALLAGVVMLAQTVGLAGADALFLAGYGAKALPTAFILASIAAVTGSIAYTFLVGRARNDSVFVWLLAATGLFLIGFAVLLFAGQRWTLYVFFSAVYVTQAVFVSLHYPTLAADYFDTVSSKRVFPYLIGCSSFGGILGGLLALGLARVVQPEWLLVAWAVFLLVAGAMLVRARRDLKRWMPVGAEGDETSVEGILGALRFIRRSALSRWLTIAVVGLVFALFLMQYLEMEIFAKSFDTPEALASFIAVYLAAANAVEILVASVIAPVLIRRLGVAQANLVHPLLTMVAFGVLAFWPTLWVAVTARANRELLDNALAGPIRSLVYNALAFRFRGRMRAFLEGIVFYAAMSSAGVALLFMRDSLDTLMMCVVGVAAAVVYFGANLMVRREYLESIVDELRSGRLDLEDVGGGLGDVEMNRLAEQWEAELGDDAPPAQGWSELPGVLIAHRIREPVERNAGRGHPVVRVACIEALATKPDEALDPILVAALGSEHSSVRRAAAVAAEKLPERSGALLRRLEGCLADADLQLRGRAAALLGTQGVGTLRAMVTDGDPRAAVEALRWVPVELLPEARQRLDDSEPAVRAGALDCAARLGDGPSLTIDRLAGALGHDESIVRLASVRALATLGHEAAAPLLARALDDRNREVRTAASDALGGMGETGVRAAAPAAASIRRWTADAALQAIARAGGEAAEDALEAVFRRRVADAWETHVSCALVPEDGDIATRFLRAALQDGHERSRSVALRALEFLEDPVVVRSVRKALDYTNPRDRADALEVLSNLGDREVASEFSLLLEESPLEDKLPSLPGASGLPARFEDVLERARASDDRWLALAARGREAGGDVPPTPEVRTMEGLLALRRVPLFAHLSLEQLEAIGRFMKEVRYLKGEVVVREGDVGEDLFVIVEGEAVALKNYGTKEQIELTTMNAEGVCYFGEIAIFDRAERSATVVVTEDARMLRLEGERFTELILQSPEISFEIFKVFSGRLRVAEERIRAQEDQERAPESSSGAS